MERAAGGWLYGPLIGIFWMIYPFSALIESRPSPERVIFSVSGAILFSGLSLWLIWFHRPLWSDTATRAEIRIRRLAVAGLTGLTIALILFSAKEWLALFFHLNITAGILLLKRDAYVAIGIFAVCTAILGMQADLAWLALPTAALGLWAIGFVSQMAAVAELRALREELALRAVAEERLRFARDLHDLLGHSLSLITLKSELAGRLLADAPQQSAREIAEIEQVARRALREVREAVAGYREPTLGESLQGASEMLEAAGINCQVVNEIGLVPRPMESVLAWAVREGITNVIRHSRAQTCLIRLERKAGFAWAEIIDDGRGSGGTAVDLSLGGRNSGGGGGSGLSGLSERVAGFEGATFVAGPQAGGGFRLYISLPLRETDSDKKEDGEKGKWR